MTRTLGAPARAAIFRACDDPDLLRKVLVFRHSLFVDCLGWQLTVIDGEERDAFDTDTTIYCALLAGDEVVGTFRAIRTDQPYLAAEVFPELASNRRFPRRQNAWEISRFGVISGTPRQTGRTLYGLMFRFARQRGATALVALADLAYERFLAFMGIRTLRYGPSRCIGSDASGWPMEVVAGEIPLTEPPSRAETRLVRLLASMEISDATHVLGSETVSA